MLWEPGIGKRTHDAIALNMRSSGSKLYNSNNRIFCSEGEGTIFLFRVHGANLTAKMCHNGVVSLIRNTGLRFQVKGMVGPARCQF